MNRSLDRRVIAGLLFVFAIVGSAASVFAQAGPGGAVTPAGGQPPLCTHAAGANQLRTPAAPNAPCGRLTDGYLARVTDGLTSANCATGGGIEVGLVQFDTSSNGWRCTSGGGGGGVSNPMSADLNAGAFKVTNLGAPTIGTDAARNITLSGGAGITDVIGDLSANRSISVNTTEIGTTTFGSGTNFSWTLDGAAATGDPTLGPLSDGIGINSTAGLGGALRIYGSATSCLRLDGTATGDMNYAQLCGAPDASGSVTVLMPVSVPGITELLTTPLAADISASSLYKVTNLVAGTTAGDSVRYEQAVKVGDACSGDLADTFPACTVTDDSHAHGNSTITAGVDAAKIGAGTVSNTELGYIDGATSSLQAQLDGKVSGPGSTTDNTVARYDLTSGKILQSSKCRIDDNGGLDCDTHPTDGGRVILKEGADDGTDMVTVAVPGTGMTSSPTHTLTTAGRLPGTSVDYTPTVQGDWLGATWLPSGTIASTFDFVAAKLKNWFGYYDVVVDITGSATPCKTAQAALREYHQPSPSPAWVGTRNIWITGKAFYIPQSELHDYGAYAVCLLATAQSNQAPDVDGYPVDGSVGIASGRRLNLDLSGLQITISRVKMSKPLVAVKIGLGDQANWSYEFAGSPTQSLWLFGSPDLGCSGTPTLAETATGTPTTTNVPASGANRSYGWAADELAGKTITMTSGAANGQAKTISTNGTSDITTTSAFSVAPAAGDTFTVSAYWLASRIPEQPSAGEIFSGAGWPQQSCIALVEHNYKRSTAGNFNPVFRSFHGGTSSAGAGSVGWVGVNSWIVDRGNYTSIGFAIGGMVYGNMISSMASFTAEGMGWGLIFGDPGLDGATPHEYYVELPRGLTINGGQLEGAYYSELVMYYGANINLRAFHIESEDANDRGLTAHVLIGPGVSGAADGYRPCWRDQDLPSGATCTPTIPTVAQTCGTGPTCRTQSWNDVNIENTSLPTDRQRKAYKLSGWSGGKSAFIAACVAKSGTAGANMTAAGRSMAADVQQYDGWYGTDTVQVRGSAGLQDQWRVGDVVSCGGQTATIAAYAGHSAGLAFGPGAFIENSSNLAVSRIGFNGSMVPAVQMADDEFLTHRHSKTGLTGQYVPFVAHATANANVDMGTAAVSNGRSVYPPKSYERSRVKLRGGLDLATTFWPSGSCVDATFYAGSWSARSSTAGTYRGPTSACYTPTSYSQHGVFAFPEATDAQIMRLDVMDKKTLVYRSGTAERFAPGYTILWRSAAQTTGSVRWCVAVNCLAAGDSPELGGVDTANSCQLFTTQGVAGALSFSTFDPFPSNTSNCAVGEYRQVTISRDADNASDDMLGTADVIGVTEEVDLNQW